MIRISPAAADDLTRITRRITKDNGGAVASRMVGRIMADLRWLEKFPHLGRSGREPDTRELVITGSPYIVIYQQRPEALAVLRVIHGAMQWPPPPPQ